MVSGIFTAAPSTVSSMPPIAWSFRPVAVTITSASSSRPSAARCPARDPLDVVGDDGGLTAAQGLEEVAVWHEADPLVPGVVRRFEVLVDVDTRGQLLTASLRMKFFTMSGRLRESWKNAIEARIAFHRTIG